MADPWPGDLGAPVVPDPGLTLSETINVHGVLVEVIRNSREGADAVLESACDKLLTVARELQDKNPEAFRRVVDEVEMNKTLG